MINEGTVSGIMLMDDGKAQLSDSYYTLPFLKKAEQMLARRHSWSKWVKRF